MGEATIGRERLLEWAGKHYIENSKKKFLGNSLSSRELFHHVLISDVVLGFMWFPQYHFNMDYLSKSCLWFL